MENRTMGNNLKALMDSFLAKYNPDNSLDVALKQAIGVAIKRNAIYDGKVESIDKKNFKAAWERRLIDMINEFDDGFAIADYENLVVGLQSFINDSFPEVVGKAAARDSGFRISHSQKSISVFAKHLWCMGRIPEPPMCPVDRRILRVALRRDQKVPAWTRVNSIEEHKRLFGILKSAADAAGLSVATWEIMSFPN